MTVVLNEKSAMLHDEDHSTGKAFERADEADLYATRTLKKHMQFCKLCFGQNRNTEEAQRLAMLEENFGEEDLPVVKRGRAPERVRPEAPASSIHAVDDAVPAGRTDLAIQ